MLSADFGHLDRDTRMVDRSAAEWVHIDVMDGVFVPNISFGFPLMPPMRKGTKKVLDTHLMIVKPERYVERFAKAGADIATVPYKVLEQMTKHPLTAPKRHHSSAGGRFRTKCSMGL
mgnify:CR=1 FL=1